jgi:hypothetical protein
MCIRDSGNTDGIHVLIEGGGEDRNATSPVFPRHTDLQADGAHCVLQAAAFFPDPDRQLDVFYSYNLDICGHGYNVLHLGVLLQPGIYSSSLWGAIGGAFAAVFLPCSLAVAVFTKPVFSLNDCP